MYPTFLDLHIAQKVRQHLTTTQQHHIFRSAITSDTSDITIISHYRPTDKAIDLLTKLSTYRYIDHHQPSMQSNVTANQSTFTPVNLHVIAPCRCGFVSTPSAIARFENCFFLHRVSTKMII